MWWALLAPAWAEQVQVELRERGTAELVEQGWLVVGDLRIEAPQGRATLDLPPGSHEVQVASPLHAPATFAVQVPADQVLRLYLRRDLAPLEVVVEARRPSPHASRQVLDRERIEETPGAFDDPFRLVQALPGVLMTREFGAGAGDIALRGAPPAESRVFLDGVELPYLYHFDQYASVVPARQLEELAVYPSAFGPTWGDAVGGVVAAESRVPSPGELHGLVDVNFIMAGAEASVPVGERWTISASGRRSYLDLVTQSNDQYTAWPVFYDGNARVDFHPSPEHDLSLVLLGAGDAYGRYAGDTAALDPLEAEAEPAFESDRDFQAVLLRADDRVGSARLRTTGGLVRDRFLGTVGTASERLDLLRGALRHDTTLTLGPHALALGADGTWEEVDLRGDTDRTWPELQGEARLLAAGFDDELSLTRIVGGAWVEPRVVGGPVTVQPGLRLQAAEDMGGPGLDPRLTVQVEATEDLRLRAAAGRYHQAPRLEEHLGADLPLGWLRAWHGVVGADAALAGRLELSAEGWGRLRDYEVSQGIDGERTVRSRALGLDLVSRYRLRERIFAAASLSLARVREDGHPTPTDQPYAINVLASWDFLPRWNAGLRWRYGAGTPFTPVVGATYDGDTDSYLAQEGEPYGDRMPPYQKVEARVERRWDLRTWNLRAYFELWWVPPGNNTLYPVYSYDYSERAYVVGPPLVPLVGLRAGF
ncbi:TonB-dependent receptor [Myxococcota bacterium]|nr:TonB-dependent receptor [Myxococcota bacterium]